MVHIALFCYIICFLVVLMWNIDAKPPTFMSSNNDNGTTTTDSGDFSSIAFFRIVLQSASWLAGEWYDETKVQ